VPHPLTRARRRASTRRRRCRCRVAIAAAAAAAATAAAVVVVPVAAVIGYRAYAPVHPCVISLCSLVSLPLLPLLLVLRRVQYCAKDMIMNSIIVMNALLRELWCLPFAKPADWPAVYEAVQVLAEAVRAAAAPGVL
jgi:hypothetical protein